MCVHDEPINVCFSNRCMVYDTLSLTMRSSYFSLLCAAGRVDRGQHAGALWPVRRDHRLRGKSLLLVLPLVPCTGLNKCVGVGQSALKHGV